PYPPFHDVMLAVDGEAAREIEELVHERWRIATRKRLRHAETPSDPWPPELPVSVSDVQVGIARTLLSPEGEPIAREVEALYLDMIKAAKRYIYLENQYFTSHTLGQALAERLAEPDGPEIIAVM